MSDRVFAIAGASGAGKTTLALHLALREGRLFCDDVLALASTQGTLRCFPGPGLANVRDGRLRRLAEAGQAPLRRVIGSRDDELRVLVDCDQRSRVLGGIYFLRRTTEFPGVSFRPTHDPAVLFRHTFNRVLSSPERLVRQLDLFALVAAAAPMYEAVAPLDTSAESLAAAVERHALRP